MLNRLAACVVAALVFAVRADIRLPAIIGDHMVLQQSTEAVLWGWADPGEGITITPTWPQAAPVRLAAGPDGRWRATVRTPAASGPFEITIEGKNSIRLRDVLIGEVWLCSGQSNMEWSVLQSRDGREEAAKASDPGLRFFTVANRFSLEPESDVQGSWVVCTPETAGRFSAVGYYFGRDLRERLQRPVGLVSADWGGTPAEAWMPEEALRAHGGFERTLDAMAALRADPQALALLHAEALAEWWATSVLGSAAWIKPEFDDSSWGEMELPATFAGDLAWFDGMVAFRREFEVPAEFAGEELVLTLGPIDDEDTVWINGRHVGGTTEPNRWNVARRYVIPPSVVRAGRNVIAVNVLDTGGAGGINGAPDQMALTGPGGRRVSLAGAWKFKAGTRAAALPPRPTARGFGPQWASALYQGMIAPLTPMRFAGVIWYQGESNVGRAEQYRTLFPALIGSWRSAFRVHLPFYFVQIAPYTYRGDTGQTALLREAQAMALRVPGTGMVVTMDIGDPDDIHPADKQSVGQRLALLALAKTYGMADVVFSGPMFQDMSVQGSRARIRFAHAHEGLAAKAPGGAAVETGAARGALQGGRRVEGDARSPALTGFWIAGEDRVFHVARAEIDGTSVLVHHPSVARPVAVRYGWGAAMQPTLANGIGLPAAPFRTDAWEDARFPDEADEVARYRATEPGFVDLFNGRDLAGWKPVNTGEATWQVRDGMIVCSGKPIGLLRTDRQYENFILEFEWKHLESPGNAGLFVWSDALPVRGQPFTRSIEVQVMVGAEGDWYTSDGDIFPIHGARLTPENPRGAGSRAFPTEKRMKPAGEWNHYRVTCLDGSISLAVNGKVVTRGHDALPRKGYICLESEGTEIHFRKIRIKELPPAREPLRPEMIATAAEGFTPLYNGLDFSGWAHGPEHEGHWRATDWTISFDGKGADLWTEQSYGDFVLIADWRWTGPAVERARPVILPDGSIQRDVEGHDVMVMVPDAGDSGIYLRGSSKSQVNIWCWPIGSGEVYGYRTDPNMPPEVRAGVTPREVADAPIGQWNRFEITMQGEYLTVVLNGKVVIERAHLPGVAAEGPIALQMHGDPIQFANLYIKELK